MICVSDVWRELDDEADQRCHLHLQPENRATLPQDHPHLGVGRTEASGTGKIIYIHTGKLTEQCPFRYGLWVRFEKPEGRTLIDVVGVVCVKCSVDKSAGSRVHPASRRYIRGRANSVRDAASPLRSEADGVACSCRTYSSQPIVAPPSATTSVRDKTFDPWYKGSSSLG